MFRESFVFIVIGENLHTTRAFRTTGRRVETEGDSTWIAFTDTEGNPRRMPVPDWYRGTPEWAGGLLKHVAIAIRIAMGEGPGSEDAVAYLRELAERQVAAGAAFLDLNVDELSPKLADQRAAMAWLVRRVQSWTKTPVSVDSSHAEIIDAGLAAARPGSGPLLNSASLERRSSLDRAVDVGGPVVVTAAGSSGMPADAPQRVTNASTMVEAAIAKGIGPGDIFVDPLIFPISVDGAFGRHALDAIRLLRERYGPTIHITGGMSNASFGIPGRKLLNEAFLKLAVEAGADSGLIDPVSIDVDATLALDLSKRPYVLARAAILGLDPDCRAFLKAYRAGEFAEFGVEPPVRKAS